MSSIQRYATLNLWWYVATAMLTGALLAIAIAVLQVGDAAALNVPPPAVGLTAQHFQEPAHACFAMPHYPTIELARSGCYR
jgi:hypothetical protein